MPDDFGEKPYRFPGFSAPSYTPIPDIVFDELAHRLSGAEYKVLMYILRRTFGFKREADSISLRQMSEGIVKYDGERLDFGAGVRSKATLVKAVKRLEELGVIVAERNSSPEKGDEATTYIPNMGGTSRVQKLNTPPCSKIEPPRVQKLNTQETVKQKTEQQHVVVALQTSQETQEQSKPPEIQAKPDITLLTKWGVSKAVAQKLAAQHDAEYLAEKVQFLEFKQARPETAVKHPAGWLRRAIEQDYAQPDGFKTPAELVAEQEQRNAAESALNAQKQALKKKERQLATESQERENRLNKRLRELEKTRGTTQTDRDNWEIVKEQLLLTHSSIKVRAIAQGSYLLGVEENIAVFAVLNEGIEKWLKDIARLLKNQLGIVGYKDVSQIKTVIISEDDKQADGT